MKVTFRDLDGKGVRVAEALTAAGHDLTGGDVLLIDADVPLAGYVEHCDRHRKVILYPHGAGPFDVSGDGQWPVHPNTVGRFVIAEGQAEILKLTGYPRRVEVCGWHLCDLRPFRETMLRRVLFAPQHVMSDGWLPDGAKERNARIHDFLAYLPVKLVVRYVPIGDHGLDALGITPQPHVRYDPAPFAVDDGVAVIDSADLVVAESGTFPSLAIARGCPTVMYGQDRPDDHQNGSDERHPARSWDRYADLARYPLDADAAQCPEDLYLLLERACQDETAIIEWRERFIGRQLDPTDFAAKFEEMAA